MEHGPAGSSRDVKKSPVGKNIVRQVTAKNRYAFRTPRPFWFEEGSPFLARLSAEFRDIPHKITPLLWSGANSIFVRDKTAHVLAERLSAEHTEHPEATQLVIAHSHGGNIALRALDHMRKIDASKPERARPLVVTLATPFVEIHEADLGSRPRYVRGALQMLVSVLTGVPLLRTSDLVDRLLLRYGPDAFGMNVYDLVSIVYIALMAVISIGVWQWFSRRAPVRRDRIDALTDATRLGEIPYQSKRNDC